MKIKYLIGTLGLSLALGLGVGAGLSAQNNGVAQKAEAANTQGSFIYAHGGNGFGAVQRVHLWDKSDYASWDNDPYMTRVGTTNTYFYQFTQDPTDKALNGIFRGANVQTGNLTGMDAINNQVFHDFTVGGTGFSAATLDNWALATSENGWSATKNPFTFSTSGTYSHRYYISYTFEAAAQFKLVNATKYASDPKHEEGWQGSHGAQAGISGVTTGTDGSNFSVPTSGTLTIWMTPTINAYGNADYIFDNVDGQMTFTADTYKIHYGGGNSKTLSLSGTSLTASGLNLTQGQEITITRNDIDFEFEVGGSADNNIDSSANVKYSATGVEVWLTNGELWVGGYKNIHEFIAGNSGANGFLADTISAGTCSDPTLGGNNSVWKRYSDWFYSFNDSEKGAFQDAINTVLANGLESYKVSEGVYEYDTELLEAAARYITLRNKYSNTWAFGNASGNLSYLASPDFGPANNSASTDSTMVIAIIAVVSVAAAGGFFLLKKKKAI